MTTTAQTVTDLLASLSPRQALCAFNVENFDTLRPAMQAAAELECPVVIAFTVPAARYLGFALTAELTASLARSYGTRYALHLDHCEQADDLRQAVAAGFSSANFLDEGALAPGSYLPTAQALRAEIGDRASLEFVLGTLGHIDHSHDHAGTPPHSPAASLDAVLDFVDACRPDIVGFECGSLHGMRDRRQGLELDLITAVSRRTGLPVVLHGSSGVRGEALQAGIDAGVRKVNIETALRSVFMTAVRSAAASDGDSSRKPRKLTEHTDAAMRRVCTDFLTSYTLRKD